MKILPILFLTLISLESYSQDLIIYQDGAELYSKVLQVSKHDVLFKKYSNLKGPTYTESISDIFMIKYEGGETDFFKTPTNINTDNIEKEEEIEDNNYAGKEISYYDGVPVISYSEKDAVIAMSLRKGRKYGKYYIAEIMIFNSTGKKIEFIPKYFIYPTFINAGIATTSVIMSYKEYNKKVKNHQAWRAFAVGFAGSYSASQAGYSTSYSSGSVNGYGTSTTNSSVNAYGSGGGWANAYGTSQTNSSINLYGSSTTTTYDGGAAYSAAQNSARDMANFSAYQKVDREQIKYDYLRRHTLKNGEEISGKINIPYKDAEIVEVTILFDGKEYIFEFTKDLILKLDD